MSGSRAGGVREPDTNQKNRTEPEEEEQIIDVSSSILGIVKGAGKPTREQAEQLYHRQVALELAKWTGGLGAAVSYWQKNPRAYASDLATVERTEHERNEAAIAADSTGKHKVGYLQRWGWEDQQPETQAAYLVEANQYPALATYLRKIGALPDKSTTETGAADGQ